MNNGTLAVVPIESKQVAPVCKFSINCVIDGFAVTLEGEGKAGDLMAIIDRLKAIGAQPPKTNHNDSISAPAKKTAPLCPDHGTPMKASRKPGAYFCPRRTDGGDYCPHKA